MKKRLRKGNEKGEVTVCGEAQNQEEGERDGDRQELKKLIAHQFWTVSKIKNGKKK